MTSRIIIDENLKEDVIEGLTSYMDLDESAIVPHLDDSDFEYIIDKMFEVESECIVRLASRIQRILDGE